MIRHFLAIVVGLIIGGVVIAAIESISVVLNPLPPGMNAADPEEMQQFLAKAPISAFLIVLAAHSMGAFSAAFACGVFVRRPWLTGSLILGTLFLAAGVANLWMIAHPLWFAVFDVSLYLPAAVLGGKCAELTLPPGSRQPSDQAPAA